MIEFDAGLDDGRDHARPGGGEAGIGENSAMGINRRARRFGRRDGERVQLFRGTARDRDLGADDIDRRFASRSRLCALGDRAEARRAPRDRLVGQRCRIVRARHRAIEMDLAEAGANIVLDQHLGPCHRRLGGQRLPGIGTEMVAAEKNAVPRQADAIRNAMDEVAEVRRLHAGIAAVLVDLVRGRLDQREGRAGPSRMDERRLDHQGMRGANGKHAARLACLVTCDQVENGLH